MSNNSPDKSERRPRILGRLAATDFVGRQTELAELAALADPSRDGGALLVAAAPATGASELLRQAYDEVFARRGAVVPFYFAVGKSDFTGETAARRFLHQFAVQTIAFRRGDAGLLDAAPEIGEIIELAPPEDASWLKRLVAAAERGKHDSPRAFVAQCLSAPLRAWAAGAVSLVMIDDLHQAETLTGGRALIEEIKQIYRRASVPLVLAGHRRFLLGAMQGAENGLDNANVLPLGALSPGDAALLAETLARRFDVSLNEQTKDLIVQQFAANPTFIVNLFLAARDRKLSLDSFQNCQQIYVEEILGGRTNRYFNGIFETIAPELKTQSEVVAVLRDALAGGESRSSIEFWRERIATASEDFYRIMRGLHLHEIVRQNQSVVEISDSSVIAGDYIRARHRLENETAPRALVFSDLLADSLKRAPQIMARYYRRSAALGLRSLLAAFDLQEVPAVFFDYGKFKRSYRGADRGEVEQTLGRETENLILPQIVFAASCQSFYEPISRLIDDERCVVAVGFETANYADENQIVWIAAEIESKLEASLETTEFWLDRLEAVAVFCNFARYRPWLIAREGFALEAMEKLRERGAMGSSLAQIKLLAAQIEAEGIVRERSRGETTGGEYELVVPMGDDTELIAARAVETFVGADFKPAAINQIKTAVVEACINAAEHSLSPDGKINLNFKTDSDKLVVTISNRGLKMSSEQTNGARGQHQANDLSGRRGLGIKIMRNLMDEVEFDQRDDGTSIRLTKYLRTEK